MPFLCPKWAPYMGSQKTPSFTDNPLNSNVFFKFPDRDTKTSTNLHRQENFLNTRTANKFDALYRLSGAAQDGPTLALHQGRKKGLDVPYN